MNKHWITILLVALLLALFVFSLSLGNSSIEFKQIVRSLLGLEKNEVIQNLVIHFRLNKSLAAILVGAALPIAGFLLQELFRNPLAGPSVLGITSSAGLGVAFVIFGFGLFGFYGLQNNAWLLVLAALIGALACLSLILIFSIKLESLTALIIVGFMLAGFSSALIGLMEYYSSANQIKTYLFWGFGSLSGLSWHQLMVMAVFVLFGLFLSGFTLKGLNALQLGEAYAQSLGINIKKLKYLVIVCSAILTASATAFVGPIGLIGLAVPHIARNVFKQRTSGELWLPTLLIGMNLMLIFMILAESFPNGGLPINLVAALIGAPIVVSILFQYKHSV